MRGQGRIFKRGAAWWIGYYRCGQEFRESSRSTKESDAKSLLRKRLGEIHSRTFIGPGQERLMFSELLDLLLLDYENNGKKNLPSLKGILKHLQAAFSIDKAVNVTETRIEQYKRARLDEGAAAGTINRELSALGRAFNLAKKRKLLSTGPMIEKLKERNVREGFVERADFDAIEENLPEDLRDFARFAFSTGWRKGEIASLLWSDVNLDSNIVRLRGENAKNGHGRIVPLEGELREIMIRRSARRRVDTDSGETKLSLHVFHRGDGRPVGDFRKRWESACKQAGLPNLLFHDLRRSGVRNMVRAGVPERVAMEISGHRTRATFDRYNIVSERDLREAIAKTQEYIKAQSDKRTVVPIHEQQAGA